MTDKKRRFFEGFEEHMKYLNALAMIRGTKLKRAIKNREKNDNTDLNSYMNLLGGQGVEKTDPINRYASDIKRDF
jgi:hypothetical protein